MNISLAPLITLVPLITAPIYRKVIRSVVPVLVGAIFASGCSMPGTNSSNTNAQQELRLSTATSSSSPEFRPSRETLFYFNNKVALQVDPNIKIDPEVVNFTAQSVANALFMGRQYAKGTSDNASYYVKPLIVYGNRYGSNYFLRSFGLSPTLQENQTYERASLVILVENALGKVVWRGAIQIYGAANFQSDMVEKRIQLTVNSLVEQLPILR